jgi:imidazole glycerol-phosphate synthase subunit HisH
MISIINYGLGNLNSIVNILKKIGVESTIISSPHELATAEKIILPGVGAFDQGMMNLQHVGWIEPLKTRVLEKKIPTLGICLGMQLMCKSSDEGKLAGLGWIDAHVKKFALPKDTALKVPHMGWNAITTTGENPLISTTQEEQRFYFVHSFHVVCNNSQDILAKASHGYEFAAAFHKENIFGVQFHPEKSHKFGMDLLKKFIAI